MKILVTGASGLIGSHIIQTLKSSGHSVFALARTPKNVVDLNPSHVVSWKHTEIPDLKKLPSVDVVIHLLGESVAGQRWTAERKKQLHESRVLSTRNLITAIQQLEKSQRPITVISASAAGYYGNTGDKIVDEDSVLGNDFLAELCRDWEAEVKTEFDPGIRKVILRFGLVLSKDGGVLSKMGPAYLGTGQQWMSWIHIDDVVQFVKQVVEQNQYHGVYNLVGPNPVRNKEFAQVYAKKIGFPFVLPAPAFALKLVLGEMAAAILGGQRVSPKRIIESGFTFQFPTLLMALDNLYKKRSPGEK